MPTTYTPLLGLALPVTGELAGTWGDVVSNYITTYLDSAVSGTQTISGTQTAVTLSVTNGASLVQVGSGATGSAQYGIINCTGAPVSLLTITVPASSRKYVVINSTSTSQSVKIVGVGPTTGVTLISGEKAVVSWNGTDFIKIASTAVAAGSNTQVQYNSSGNLAGSANLTFDGTNLTLGGGTANGVAYLNGSKVLTTGSALSFDGTNLGVGGSPIAFGGSFVVSQITGGTAGGGYSLQKSNTVVSQIAADDSASVAYVGTRSAHPLVFTYNNAEAMRLTSTGLGIGTSSPAAKLDVNGASILRGNVTTTGAFIPGANVSAPTADASVYRAADNTLAFATASTQRMTLDASGNLGLGVTPSANNGVRTLIVADQGGSLNALTLGAPTGGYGEIGYGFGFNGAAFKYLINDFASKITFKAGGVQFSTAPSGTAGNAISFTQAMTLDASGNLGLGTTNPAAYAAKAMVVGSASSQNLLTIQDTGTTYGSNKYYEWFINSAGASAGWITHTEAQGIGLGSDSALLLYAGGATERARITSGGDFALGNPTTNNRALIYTGGVVAGYLQVANGSTGVAASNGTRLGVQAGGNAELITDLSLILSTANVERARIDASGNLLVGTTTGGGAGGLTVYPLGSGAGSAAIAVWNKTNTGAETAAQFRVSATTIGSISYSNTAVAFNTTSDYRLKENQQPLTGSGAFIDALKPKTWDWTVDGSKGVGFIAHEVQEVSPGTVVGTKDAVDEEGKPKYQAMEYGSAEFIANIVAELQSLRARVAALETN